MTTGEENSTAMRKFVDYLELGLIIALENAVKIYSLTPLHKDKNGRIYANSFGIALIGKLGIDKALKIISSERYKKAVDAYTFFSEKFKLPKGILLRIEGAQWNLRNTLDGPATIESIIQSLKEGDLVNA